MMPQDWPSHGAIQVSDLYMRRVPREHSGTFWLSLFHFPSLPTLLPTPPCSFSSPSSFMVPSLLTHKFWLPYPFPLSPQVPAQHAPGPPGSLLLHPPRGQGGRGLGRSWEGVGRAGRVEAGGSWERRLHLPHPPPLSPSPSPSHTHARAHTHTYSVSPPSPPSLLSGRPGGAHWQRQELDLARALSNGRARKRLRADRWGGHEDARRAPPALENVAHPPGRVEEARRRAGREGREGREVRGGH